MPTPSNPPYLPRFRAFSSSTSISSLRLRQAARAVSAKSEGCRSDGGVLMRSRTRLSDLAIALTDVSAAIASLSSSNEVEIVTDLTGALCLDADSLRYVV